MTYMYSYLRFTIDIIFSICLLIFVQMEVPAQQTFGAIDTLATSTEFIALLRQAPGRLAWREEFGNGRAEIIVLESGKRDTIVTPGENYPYNFQITKTMVGCDYYDIATSSVSSSMQYYDGSYFQDDRQATNTLVSNGINFVRSYYDPDYQFDLFGASNDTIISMPFTYQGHTFTTGNAFNYVGDYLFFSAFTGSTNSLFKYQVSSDQLTKIYEDFFVNFGPQQGEGKLVFLTRNSGNESTMRYYDGGQVDSITSGLLFLGTSVFKDGVVYQTENGIIYYYEDGSVKVVDAPGSNSGPSQASDCFIAWIKVNGVGTNFINTDFFIYNGVSVDTINISGKAGIHDMFLDGQNLIFVHQTADQSRFHVLRAEFPTKCACSGVDILTSDSENHVSKTYIKSSAAVHGTSALNYRALQYVELLPTFELPQMVDFQISIEDCEE